MGKGSFTRPTDKAAYDRNFQGTFGVQKPPVTWDPSTDPHCVTFLEETNEPEDEGAPAYRCGVCYSYIDPWTSHPTGEIDRCPDCGRYFVASKQAYLDLQKETPND